MGRAKSKASGAEISPTKKLTKGVNYIIPLGKPVQLLIAGTDPTPSDFVRTEWLRFDPDARDASRAALDTRFRAIEALADFYSKLGEVGLEADVIDYELTFERFKQAVLISGHAAARAQIEAIADRLRQPDAVPGNMAITASGYGKLCPIS